MQLSVPDYFLIFASVIILGWLGQLFFERTRIPDVLLLLGLGYALGPWTHALSPEALRQVSPHFGALALVIILFDGGLMLRLRDLLQHWGSALVLTVLSFALGTLCIAWAATHWLGLGWPVALLLGAILSGAPSGVVAIPVVSKMKVGADVKTVVSLEASLSDVFSIVTVVLGVGLLLPGAAQSANPLTMLVEAFAFSGLIGAVVGLGWLVGLRLAKDSSVTYMLTLAVLFLAYGTAEHLGASGALTVLLTGVVVANADSMFTGLGRALQRRARAWGVPAGSLAMQKLDWGGRFKAPEPALLSFNREAAFFVRTFFFVFLGVVAELPADLAAALPYFLVFGAALVARALAVGAFVGAFPAHRAAAGAYWVIVPRGLAAAALAYLPASQGVPGTEAFPALAFVFVVLSNLLLTLGVPWVERSGAPAPPPPKRRTARK